MEVNIERLGKIVLKYKKAAILPHINPDPDAVASAWGVKKLLKLKWGIDSEIFVSGIIGRYENKTMVKRLQLPIKSILQIDEYADDETLFIITDTQPGVGNLDYDFTDKPLCVFDHHPLNFDKEQCSYVHVDSELGSTSTMISQYFKEADIKYDKYLATALFYGIKTDTRELSRSGTNLDSYHYNYNFILADKEILFEIEHPKLPYNFFLILKKAIDVSLLYKNVLICNLGVIDLPDFVPQMADFLMQFEEVEWVLCMGIVDNELIISARNRLETYNAGKIIKSIVGDYGSGGGHGYMAGGRIPLEDRTSSEIIDITEELMYKTRKHFQVQNENGKSFISYFSLMYKLKRTKEK